MRREGEVMRALLERRILVPLLVGYVVMLVVAAWRHEIRPAVFDRATVFARGALGHAGIVPGVAVFTADTGRTQGAKIAAICLEVRALSESGTGRQIYPAEDASCPARPPRLWVRGEQIFLNHAVMNLRTAVVARRAGDSDPSLRRFAKLLARSIAAHFIGRDRLTGTAADIYTLLWREARISYRTRARSDHIVALFDWRSAPDPQLFIVWQPDAATLREHGWDPGEP
jgi:hypothetical protein